ncbi:DEAD/DEAH box helicase [Sphingobacterium griseoflavum]|uniref:DEAD/DEAH box family ATP-dependent RNA helicase n=1 Tax=Sphingobacterium griseoflavum TaxID=1474952 RepID=A0ABQ3HTE8_9SPHI|nr:DEAD/DEAH box helicase [Sphingobacterium griseoflavum]GHE33086.1 DEAD/DEAH box family ATP-dependent RNA helicase [Sphingobacterium griseoflavum]
MTQKLASNYIKGAEPIMTFQDLNIIPPILDAIREMGYNTPSPIQEKAIPVILGDKDLIGCAQTGTGKTAAFAIPAIQKIAAVKAQHGAPRVLVLTPTRELAVQIEENFAAYGKYLKTRQTLIFGGVSAHAQVNSLRKGTDIIIATPGRLLDLARQNQLKLSSIEILVLDEADTMLDMGFVNDIKKILSFLPVKRQTLFFSATMPPPIRKFATSILRDTVEINVNPVSSTAALIEQSVYHVEKTDKPKFLVSLLRHETANQTLVFTRTKHGADRVAKLLNKQGFHAMAIHGNKSQGARQKALSEFKHGKIQILVATDIAARGIDIDELPHVINYELPEVSETYVHRIGRTGRAGKTGRAISLCSTEERKNLDGIQKLTGNTIKVAKLR